MLTAIILSVYAFASSKFHIDVGGALLTECKESKACICEAVFK